MTEVQHVEQDLGAKIEKLRSEHRALDQELKNIAEDPLIDDLQLQRLKKRKLFLKDSISHLESRLVPDITA
ncbi:MAG: YdcH family protein [Arenicellales bacterium]